MMMKWGKIAYLFLAFCVRVRTHAFGKNSFGLMVTVGSMARHPDHLNLMMNKFRMNYFDNGMRLSMALLFRFAMHHIGKKAIRISACQCIEQTQCDSCCGLKRFNRHTIVTVLEKVDKRKIVPLNDRHVTCVNNVDQAWLVRAIIESISFRM